MSARRAPKPPRVYFSLRSPFSWMALRRLQEELPEAVDHMEFLPFWDPDPDTLAAVRARDADFHYVQMSKAKHYYILHDTKRLAARFGYTLAWPIDVDPWWELPNHAWLRARREGLGLPFYRTLTEARWERGEDICDRDVVARAAEQAGFDPVAALTAHEDASIREEGIDALVAGYNDDIFGVPYFRVGRHRFWGLDRFDDFAEVMAPLLEERPAEARAVPAV